MFPKSRMSVAVRVLHDGRGSNDPNSVFDLRLLDLWWVAIVERDAANW